MYSESDMRILYLPVGNGQGITNRCDFYARLVLLLIDLAEVGTLMVRDDLKPELAILANIVT